MCQPDKHVMEDDNDKSGVRQLTARQLFSEELARNGEHQLAEMVRLGLDNSNGGTAAIRAIMRALTPPPVEEIAKAIAEEISSDIHLRVASAANQVAYMFQGGGIGWDK